MSAELLPGHLLDQFFQRADAAGKGDECVGAFEHQPLAFVHVRRDDQLGQVRIHALAVGKKIGNDPGHGAAVIQHGFGDRTHQTDRSAAINEANTVLSEHLAQRDRSFHETGVRAGAGTAIHADGFDLVHAIYVALQRKKLKSENIRPQWF